MNTNNWEKIPFQSISGSLTTNKIETHLSFNIGAITRHGQAHNNLGINNQDSINIVLEDDLIIGVMGDGCTNNHPSIVNDYSLNSVGASILSHMISYLCLENIKPRKNRINIPKFLGWLSEQTISRMNRLDRTLRIPKEELQSFRLNLMTSTIIGFVIRKKEFFVFNCGDGIVRVNDQQYSLDHGYSSLYNSIKDGVMFKEVTSGQTKNLHSMAIITDGFTDEVRNSKPFIDMVNNTSSHVDKGYIDLIPEFHLDVLNSLPENIHSKWPNDDASLILIRKSKNK